MVFVPTWFRFILFFHIICTIVFRRFLGIINVGCLEFHCYVAFLQNTSSGILLTESMITLLGWVGKYSPKYIFNQSEGNIYFKVTPNWLFWIVWMHSCILLNIFLKNLTNAYAWLTEPWYVKSTLAFCMNPFRIFYNYFPLNCLRLDCNNSYLTSATDEIPNNVLKTCFAELIWILSTDKCRLNLRRRK